MRLLLTRPIQESEKTARMLNKSGASVTIDPLINITFGTKTPIDLSQMQAIIFTSVNAVRAYQRNYDDCSLPAYTVGAKTALAAQGIGIKKVINADGDVKKLSNTIADALNSRKSALFYPCGNHVAGTLQDDLERIGFKIIKEVLYHAEAATELKENTKKLLKSGMIDFIPFYSPRSALIFIELVKNAGLKNSMNNISALCLSPAIEKIVARLNWKKILTSTKPAQSDLFKLINIEL